MSTIMHCIILDDEPLARQGVELLLEPYDWLKLEGSYGNPLQAISRMEEGGIDLLFLDIEMPSITGLELLHNLSEPPLTIITTAYPQYAIEGFDLQVADYLLKPISEERFQRAVLRARQLFESEQSRNTETQSLLPYFFVRSDRKLVKLAFHDIRYIEGMKDYVVLHCADGNTVVTAMNLATIYRQLPESKFARIGKSHIINVDYITEVENTGVYLDKDYLPIGRAYRERFFEYYVSGRIIDRNS